MDSYGDSITIGCRGKIAHYRLLDFFSLWEWGKGGRCVCVCVRRWNVCVGLSLDVYKLLSMNESTECGWVYVQILACVTRARELQRSSHKSAPRSVCARGSGSVFVCFTWAYACAILFNYRSVFEAEANSVIITGNTSFNILWKSTLCVSCELDVFIQHERERGKGERARERARGVKYIEDLFWMTSDSYLMIWCPSFQFYLPLHRLSFQICGSKWPC